jgi:hypothetical protein
MIAVNKQMKIKSIQLAVVKIKFGFFLNFAKAIFNGLVSWLLMLSIFFNLK